MLLNWFDARQATEAGVALADQLAPGRPKRPPGSPRPGDALTALRRLLDDASRRIVPLQLNFYKKAKLANSFKWRLLNNGVDRASADEFTHALVTQLSLSAASAKRETSERENAPRPLGAAASRDPDKLLAIASQQARDGDYISAASSYEAVIVLRPKHAVAMNNLGAALFKLGRFEEAEDWFRRAIGLRSGYADAHRNLGTLLRSRGDLTASEQSLRRALKLKPSDVDTRISLGLTTLTDGRMVEARDHLVKALRARPSDCGALFGVSQIDLAEGKFDEAGNTLKRILEIDEASVEAWAAQVSLRKMTKADSQWAEKSQQMLRKQALPQRQANLHFALGKYCDDVEEYASAFEHFRKANDIMRGLATPYDSASHVAFADKVIERWSGGVLSSESAQTNDSSCPILVVGMPRSGTSLIEQIIASHPDAQGAGELGFWSDAVRRDGKLILDGAPPEKARLNLASSYLRALRRHAAEAERVVDKAPGNSDYLGLIHATFPNAKIIHVDRDPVDTCLSCYFQQFHVGLHFAFDLKNLADYYLQHRRLIEHWIRVLPSETILTVPYEELVREQERWTRRILDFVGLDWNARCMRFNETSRTVATASAWQVRQGLFSHSIGRSRHYKNYLGPLNGLRRSTV